MKFLSFFLVLLFGLLTQNAQATSFPIVDSYDALETVCKGIQSKDYIAVDLEFEGHEPCLIQVCWGEDETDGALIDYLALDRVKPKGTRHALGSFKAILDNPVIIKVFHAPTQDLKILYTLMGDLPKSVVDTQAMYATITPKYQAGYAAVVEDFFLEKLDKSQQRSSWKTRPLTSEQLVYATRDVTYLFRLYPLLSENLQRLDRQDFMAEYFSRTMTSIAFMQKGFSPTSRSAMQQPVAQIDENSDSNQFIRFLMSTLKRRAQDLSIAPQMLATKANFQELISRTGTPLVVGERGKLLGWEIQFLLKTYSANPSLTRRWTNVVQSIKKDEVV